MGAVTDRAAERPTRLAQVLAAGHFAVAVEVCPPRGPNPGAVERQIDVLAGCADAYNVTDNQSARVHMSSLAVSVMLQQAGLEPVFQVTCRDRNRLAMQADLLGAAGFGIRNVLAIGGDHVSAGDHPQARAVYDLDSINLVHMIQRMRDGQVYENGKSIPKRAPDFFVGAVANPFAPPYALRPLRLAKKVAAGAQFIQTQLIYDVARFRDFMARVVDLGLHEQVAILAGIGPIRSLRAAQYMARQVPGLVVPEPVIRRMEGLSKEDQPRAGLDLCCEIAREVREIEGVRGLHIMAVGWPTAVPQIMERLDLYPRPHLAADLEPPASSIQHQASSIQYRASSNK